MLLKQEIQLNRIKNFRKGFTLIELLVAITIVAILSYIVLVSIISARDKSRDSAIIMELKTIQTQAELYFQNNKNYATNATTGGAKCPVNVSQGYGMFKADSKINLAARTIMKKVKYPNFLGSSLCAATPKTWVAVARLRSFPISTNGAPSASDHLWCVDYQGKSELVIGTATYDTFGNFDSLPPVYGCP